MSPKSESIAISSSNLVNSQIKFKKELSKLSYLRNECNEPEHNDRIEDIEFELKKINEDIKIIEKKIENEVFKIVKDNDVIAIGLFDDFITVDGIRVLSDVELQKIANYIGYKHYKVQPYAYWLTIYFSDDWEVFDV